MGVSSVFSAERGSAPTDAKADKSQNLSEGLYTSDEIKVFRGGRVAFTKGA